MSQILQRVAPLRSVFEAAAAEPGVTEVWANAEQLRLDGYRTIVELLAGKQPLTAGHTLDSATDVLFVLLGPDTFRAFTHGRGWPLDQWKAWVTTALEQDLFTPPAAGPAGANTAPLSRPPGQQPRAGRHSPAKAPDNQR